MSYKGKLIEYVEHGKFICAMVVEDTGKRLRLVNQNGREVALPPSRIVHLANRHDFSAASREETIRELKQVAEKRQTLKESIDLEQVWELAIEETDTMFSPRFLAALSLGEDATDDHEAAFLRSVFDNPLYFKYRQGNILVFPEEIVEQQRHRLEIERQKEALMTESSRGLQEIMAGNMTFDWPEKEECMDILADYYLHENEAKERDTARELLKSARLTKPHDVYRLFVKAGIWDKNENIPVLRYNLPDDFDNALEEYAASLKLPTSEELLQEGRKDFRDLPLITIDGEQTRDFDDALHVEQKGDEYVVGIHITDVSRFIKPDDPLFVEAKKRLTSVYFADGQIPMFPTVVSEGLCSLIKDEDRAAVSFIARIAKDGQILDVDIYPSIVRVKRQITYQEAETLLKSDKELKLLYAISQQLLKNRIEGGAILLPIPDVVVNIEEGEVKSIELMDVDTPTRTLVAEFMVLANTLAASYVANQQVSGLFRCQGQPGQTLYQGMQKDLYLNFRQRKHLSPAQLLTDPKRHACVGTSQYTTITSPIRRFLDLVMQHQISSLLRGTGAIFSDKDLKDMIPAMVAGQSKINLVKRLRHRYWILKFLEKQVGAKVDALLLEKGPRRFSVVLLDVLLEGDLPANQAITEKPGDVIKVKIGKVSPLDDQLRLEW